jgi:alpha-tubulin suppressor-like RCC1 family protein
VIGLSKDGHLGPNSSYENFTKFNVVEDGEVFNEVFVDLSSGTHFTLFVTESGKLFGSGNRFIKEIGMDTEQKIIPIPLPEGVKCLKAYASMGKS